MKNSKNLALYLVGVIAVLALPLLLQSQGNAWVRIADIALLYVLLALGLNIVVGYAGLLDLGYVRSSRSVPTSTPSWARATCRRPSSGSRPPSRTACTPRC